MSNQAQPAFFFQMFDDFDEKLFSATPVFVRVVALFNLFSLGVIGKVEVSDG